MTAADRLIITPRAPYDFALTRDTGRLMYSMATIDPDGGWRRVVSVGSARVLIRCRSIGTVETPRIAVDVLASDAPVAPDALPPVAERILNADHDLTSFYAVAAGDPPLHRTTQAMRGLQVFRADTLIEALATTIIEQQITLKMAQTSERALMALYGATLTPADGGAPQPMFPTAAWLAERTIDDLLPLKITRRRLGALIALAQLVAADDPRLPAWLALPPVEAQRALTALGGIGMWTAAWVVIRARGRFPYIGSADVALRAAVNHDYFDSPGRCDPARVDAVFSAYGDHAGIAAYYTLMHWANTRY